MAGIGDLLSVLMQGGLSPAGNQRAGSAMNGMGQSGGILGQVLGGGTAGGSTGRGDLMGSLLGVVWAHSPAPCWVAAHSRARLAVVVWRYWQALPCRHSKMPTEHRLVYRH